VAAAQFLHKRAVLCVSRRGNVDLEGVMRRAARRWLNFEKSRINAARSERDRAHRFVTQKPLVSKWNKRIAAPVALGIMLSKLILGLTAAQKTTVYHFL
jgi:hypothetical protein